VRPINKIHPYGGADPRELPAYSIAETAHYLSIPQTTIGSWVRGRSYAAKEGPRLSPGIIKAADPRRSLLSFINLLELHVLGAIRREHDIDMRRVRKAVGHLAEKFGSEHPLIDREMLTDGTDLFVNHLGDLVNLSKDGQLAMRDMLAAYLKRIDRDANGLAVRLYPFTRPSSAVDAPRLIVIDPRRAFGRPVIAGTRVPTTDVFERFKAGDSLEDLVAEYGRSTQEVQEAIRYEAELAA
jgi:uncharacterized protein (DUF433 family)